MEEDFNNFGEYNLDGGLPKASNQNVSGNAAENSSKQNLVHVTLSQIAKLSNKEHNLVIYRQSVHSIVAIGVVLSVEELTTKNIYSIDDYTSGGPIDVQLWKNDPESTGSVFVPPTIMERTYAKVIGQVRYDDSKPFIVAYRVQPINDPNEVYCHFLETIQDSLFLELRMNETLNAKNGDVSFHGKDNTTNADFDTTASRTMTGFSEIQRSVLNILNRYGRDSPFGLKRADIRSYMAGVSANVIDNAIQFLVDEGHIFSTTDEDTFKSTDY